MNTLGTLVRLTTFGESHGPAMGGILDGMPPMVHIDTVKVQQFLDRRRPGSRPHVSQRRESDCLEILSGISSDGYTLGTPIGFIIRNRDARSSDYENYKGLLRPNHADYTYLKKYGYTQLPGGGRASARETVNWVAAGAICAQWLETSGIRITAHFTETNPVVQTAGNGDSTGGIVEGYIQGLPAGLGEPVFDKYHARLASAMMGINAAKAFEYGDGIKAAYSLGSESIDKFREGLPDNAPCTGNHSGGVQGGITNGMEVNFRVYFKPTPTIMRELETVDADGKSTCLHPKGRHDPCVAIRAVPVVEALAWLVTADMLRLAKSL